MVVETKFDETVSDDNRSKALGTCKSTIDATMQSAERSLSICVRIRRAHPLTPQNDMRDLTLSVALKAGTVFNVTCTLNGYLVIPSNGSDPNAWSGIIPDAAIPLVVMVAGVKGSTYELKYKIGSADEVASSRVLPNGGVDVVEKDI